MKDRDRVSHLLDESERRLAAILTAKKMANKETKEDIKKQFPDDGVIVSHDKR